jgi:hypothetical protein
MICLPKEYKLIPSRPNLSINNFDGGDMNWEDTLFLNSVDHTYIRLYINRKGKIDTPDDFRSPCLIKRWVDVRKYTDTSNDESYYQKYNYSSCISAGFFYKNDRSISIQFYFNKYADETIERQTAKAMKMLRTLTIDDIHTCMSDDDVRYFKDEDWGRYVDTYSSDKPN